MDDLARGSRYQLIHSVRHDIPGAHENHLAVCPAPNETRDAARFVDGDRLIALHRVLVASDLGDDGVAQSETLVAMLLHVFDVDVVSFRNVDGANGFEET